MDEKTWKKNNKDLKKVPRWTYALTNKKYPRVEQNEKKNLAMMTYMDSGL